MKKNKLYPLIAVTSLITLMTVPIINNQNNLKQLSQDFYKNNLQENSIEEIDLYLDPTVINAEEILVTNPDILKDKNVGEIRALLETRPMTQVILNQLSIVLPVGLDPESVSFTNIDINNLFKVTFTINYAGVAKSTNDFLNATPTNQEIVDSIVIENFDIVNSKKVNEIKSILETNPMTQGILDQLSILLPTGSDPSLVSFTNIDTTNLLRITFTINYNGVEKTTSDYLNALATNQELANSLFVADNDILKTKTVLQIRDEFLGKKPMTQEILNQLSITLPEGLLASRVSFTNINISNLFEVTFNINYNGALKLVPDFLKATPTDQDVANLITINNRNSVSDQKVNQIRAILETNPMNQTVLSQITCLIPEGADPAKVTFTNINTNNPFKITFVISYNGVAKSTSDFLNANFTEQEIANQIIVNDYDAVKTQNVLNIRSLLETKPMTQGILTQLSISTPEGIDVSKVTFSRINISNLFKVTFVISYNGFSKENGDFLNATPTDQDVVNQIIITDNNILKSKTVAQIKSLLITNPMTQAVLDQLSISFPEGAQWTRITFTNINITNPLKATFTINYNGVEKGVGDFLNGTPTDQEIANVINVTNADILKTKNVAYIRNILEKKPMTQATLAQLSIVLPEGSLASKVTFTNINITNLFSVTFTINYNGVAKLNGDFLNATPTDQEIVLSMIVENKNILNSKKVAEIGEILLTPVITLDILNQLSISFPEGANPALVSFTDINIDNPLKATFTINYNGISKGSREFLFAFATDQEIVNVMTVQNVNILKPKKVEEIQAILQTNPMSLIVLNQLLISFPEGADPTLVSFTDINIDNLFQITFLISYNGVTKLTSDFLSATPDNKEVANLIIINNPSILQDQTITYFKNLLLTNPLTEEILKELSIILPIGIDISKIKFVDIKVVDIFQISCVITYNGIPKDSIDFFNITASDFEIVNLIVVESIELPSSQDVHDLRKMLQTNPMTQAILDKVGVKVPLKADVSKVTFVDITINNDNKISFKIQYNGALKDEIIAVNILDKGPNVILIAVSSTLGVVIAILSVGIVLALLKIKQINQQPSEILKTRLVSLSKIAKENVKNMEELDEWDKMIEMIEKDK